MIKTKKVIANGLFGRREIEKNTPEYAKVIQQTKRSVLTGDALKQAHRSGMAKIRLKEDKVIFRKRFGGYRIPII